MSEQKDVSTKLKKWMVAKLLKWAKILNIEQAIRDAYRKGGDEREKKLTQRVNVWYDPTVRSYPQQEPKSAVYEPPEKQTDPYGAIHQQLQQRRDMMHAHNNALLRKNRLMPEIIRTNTAPLDEETDFPKWLREMPISVKDMTPEQIERVPTIRDLTPDITEEMPAVVKLLHERRYAG